MGNKSVGLDDIHGSFEFNYLRIQLSKIGSELMWAVKIYSTSIPSDHKGIDLFFSFDLKT